MLLALVVFLGLWGLVIPPFVSQVPDVVDNVQQGAGQVADVAAPLGITGEDVQRGDPAGSRAAAERRDGRASCSRGAMLVVQWAAAVILIAVLTFFFLKDGEQLRDWTVGLFAEQRRPVLRELLVRAWDALAAYVQGVFLVATMDAVLIGIALVLVGVPIALPLIVLTFIGAFFPVIGAFLAGGAAVLVALVSGGAVDAAIILVVIVVVQQLEGNVFYPVVVGKRLRLHPVAILLALTAGGVLAGVAGAFLAIPIAAVVSAVLDFTREHRAAQRSQAVVSLLMDADMRSYYRQRAPEYDDWWLGTGLFEQRDRPGWHEDVAALCAALEALPPARTLDVACGTGFLTAPPPRRAHRARPVAEMLAIAAERLPGATFVQGDAMDAAARPVRPGPRGALLRAPGPRRSASSGSRWPRDLAPELVIVDSARRDREEAWDERKLNDGSRHQVYKRWFTADGLAAELGGAEPIHAGPWFVAVRRQTLKGLAPYGSEMK